MGSKLNKLKKKKKKNEDIIVEDEDPYKYLDKYEEEPDLNKDNL